MGLVAMNSGGSRTPAPAGTHVANCFGLVDLGTQVGSYQGKETRRHQCWLWWELADERTDDGKPVTIGGFYTISLNEKATLRKMLESWRGRPFTTEELQGFLLSNVVGKPCMLSIIHEEKQGGGVRDKISAVTAVPKSVKPEPPVSKTVVLDLDADKFDRDVYDALPNFLKDMILKSDEGQRAVNGVATHRPETWDDDGQQQGGDIPF